MGTNDKINSDPIPLNTKIITFNLLEPEQDKDDYYPFTQKMGTDLHVKRIKNLALLWMEGKNIICFREMNAHWNNVLTDLFHSNGYGYRSEMTIGDAVFFTGIGYPLDPELIIACEQYIKPNFKHLYDDIKSHKK